LPHTHTQTSCFGNEFVTAKQNMKSWLLKERERERKKTRTTRKRYNVGDVEKDEVMMVLAPEQEKLHGKTSEILLVLLVFCFFLNE
jgi:hypothetical protein